jgi:DNA-directed RNA polymerase specialized sigma24 family protein
MVILIEAVIAASHGSPLKGPKFMSDHNRHQDERLPEFFLPPAVNGYHIDPGVRDVAQRLWPWAWNYIGTHLADHAGAAEVAELVAYRISRHIKNHPGEVRSIVALYYTATANLIRSIKSRDGRVDYRGLGQDLEILTTAQEPDWRQEVELWILAEEIGQHFEPDIREMFYLRLLELGWEEIGKLQGLTAGQARLRFRRALEKLPQEIIDCLLPDTEERARRAPQTPKRGLT